MMRADHKNLYKVVIFAGFLNILGLILIMVSILKLTPITLLISITLAGGLIAVAIILYFYAVVQDLKMRKVL
ncbi:hypothetical protein MYX76_10675 [Desulfobacterota bacterium AH_259_B03_O07]|nr:hypothetical protein [Desulfobacterota bacterium AH_259_B03_O07]